MSSVLDSLVRKHPEMVAAETMLRTLATALPEAMLVAGVPRLGAVEARLAGGVPALEGEPLLTGAALLSNLELLAAALESSAAPEVRAIPRTLERELTIAAANELAGAAQSGSWDGIGALAERIGLEADAVITLVDHAARPALRAGARAVHEVVAKSRWRRGTCPACGAAPLLAEVRGGGKTGGAEHERVLRCGRCLTAWAFHRLRCVSCGETNHRQLAYLHGAGEESFRRAEVCSTCRGYLKSIAVLAPLDRYELLAADLATAALDVAALERGFHRT
jgi:FdhE protein